MMTAERPHPRRRRTSMIVAACVFAALAPATGFVVSQSPQLGGLASARRPQMIPALQQKNALTTSTTGVHQRRPRGASSTSLKMVWNSGGGILGVGTPEVIVCCLVGYFLLGPKELYKLSKDIGKLVSQARNVIAESAAEWQQTMDAQFEFEELKDLQNSARELRDAFDFRSSRYLNEWRDYTGAKPPDPLAPKKTPPPPRPQAPPTTQMSALSQQQAPPAERFHEQLDVDAWNAQVLAHDGQLPLPDPPAVDEALAGKKDLALQQLEREYELKLKELQLEYDFKREKARIDYATTEDDLAAADAKAPQV